MINKKTVTQEKKITVSITCDVCKKTYNTNALEAYATEDIFELQEFTHIKSNGGYGSVFGDGDDIECDICQHCLKEKLGDFIRITEGH